MMTFVRGLGAGLGSLLLARVVWTGPASPFSWRGPENSGCQPGSQPPQGLLSTWLFEVSLDEVLEGLVPKPDFASRPARNWPVFCQISSNAPDLLWETAQGGDTVQHEILCSCW